MSAPHASAPADILHTSIHKTMLILATAGSKRRTGAHGTPAWSERVLVARGYCV